jgi:hypothetical protein
MVDWMIDSLSIEATWPYLHCLSYAYVHVLIFDDMHHVNPEENHISTNIHPYIPIGAITSFRVITGLKQCSQPVSPARYGLRLCRGRIWNHELTGQWIDTVVWPGYRSIDIYRYLNSGSNTERSLLHKERNNDPRIVNLRPTPHSVASPMHAVGRCSEGIL